jgi:hypothetical protein
MFFYQDFPSEQGRPAALDADEELPDAPEGIEQPAPGDLRLMDPLAG